MADSLHPASMPRSRERLVVLGNVGFSGELVDGPQQAVGILLSGIVGALMVALPRGPEPCGIP